MVKKMEEDLCRLYNECIKELQDININIINNSIIGNIDIKIAKRESKRYGCCRQEEPDIRYYHIEKRGRRNYKVYDVFKRHHIEVCKWVMKLDKKIIKNTIMHELIHCLPNCNNHGKEFKKYAKYINENLGYNISTLGNKEDDFKKSNLEYVEDNIKYNYLITCKNCKQTFYRQRITKNFERRYICKMCGGKFEVSNI